LLLCTLISVRMNLHEFPRPAALVNSSSSSSEGGLILGGAVAAEPTEVVKDSSENETNVVAVIDMVNLVV